MKDSVYGDEIQDNFTEFDPNKATVWIDPLDGTRDFTKGNLSAVTVLIGLAIDGLPKLGVVHHPFRTNDNDGKGMTIFGAQEYGAYFLNYDSKASKVDMDKRIPQYMEPFDVRADLDE